MASLSVKRIAKSNEQSLKLLHVVSLVINVLTIIEALLLNRAGTIWIYLIFSMPALFCEYFLETWGRPQRVNGKLRNLDDIKGPGLYEYMFDCIYITWTCTILMLILGTNKVWILYLIVPSYISYKAFATLRGLLGYPGLKK